MSEQEVKKPSLLSQLQEQRAQYIQQRDYMQTNLNQLVGAIFACDIMIKKYEEAESELISNIAGGQGNVEANNESQEGNS